jgi:hypothetical protein
MSSTLTLDDCIHDLAPESCSYCRRQHLPTVYVSEGGAAYHATDRCPALERGQNDVSARGGQPGEIGAVRPGSPLLDGRKPCRTCKPVKL